MRQPSNGHRQGARQPRFCMGCGTELASDAAYCTSCGRPVFGAVKTASNARGKALLLLILSGFLWGVVPLFPSNTVRGLLFIGAIGAFVVAVILVRNLQWRLLLYVPLAFIAMYVLAGVLQTFLI